MAAEGARMTPGIHYGVSMADYLAVKAVSAGLICRLLESSPAAALFDSPWNPERVVDSSKEQDVGSIAHAIFLEGSRDCCEVIDPAAHPNEDGKGFAKGWTNKSIKAARERAKLAGKIPILKHALPEIERLAGAARAFVDSLQAEEPAIYSMFLPDGGKSECVVIWEEAGTLCKMRADRISNDLAVMADYKTTSSSAEPSHFGRTQLVGLNYYVSASWYRRGIRALTYGVVDPAYVFIAGETARPHFHSLIGCAPSLAALGDEKVGEGLRRWQECERVNDWPAYPTRVAWVEAPTYERMRWDERNGVDEDGLPPSDVIFGRAA
jgi:hypothetical protein